MVGHHEGLPLQSLYVMKAMTGAPPDGNAASFALYDTFWVSTRERSMSCVEGML